MSAFFVYFCNYRFWEEIQISSWLNVSEIIADYRKSSVDIFFIEHTRFSEKFETIKASHFKCRKTRENKKISVDFSLYAVTVSCVIYLWIFQGNIWGWKCIFWHLFCYLYLFFFLCHTHFIVPLCQFSILCSFIS